MEEIREKYTKKGENVGNKGREREEKGLRKTDQKESGTLNKGRES